MPKPGERGNSPGPPGFTEIYRRCGGRLYGTAVRMLGRPEEAEEAMQETFLKFYSRPLRPSATPPEAWLHRVLVNDCLDRLRRRKRRPEDELGDRPAPAAATPRGLGIDLQRAVERLPEGARRVFLLHDLEGFKHREIAAMLGVTEGGTKSQLSRARRLLRDFIAGREGATP